MPWAAAPGHKSHRHRQVGADHLERLPFGLLSEPTFALLAQRWKHLPQLPRRGAGRWVAFQGLDQPQLPRRGTGRWVVFLAEQFDLMMMLGQLGLTSPLVRQHCRTNRQGKDRQG